MDIFPGFWPRRKTLGNAVNFIGWGVRLIGELWNRWAKSVGRVDWQLRYQSLQGKNKPRNQSDMDGAWLTFLVVLLTLLVGSYLTATKTDFFEDYIFVPWRRRWLGRPRWWRPFPWPRERIRYVTYVEPFADSGAPLKEKKEDMRDVAYPDLYNDKAYHLLGDEMAPANGGTTNTNAPERVSCVNSRSCYATSFDRFLEQTGNFRQMTNNYKRGYPDSCSSPFQELVLSFYKAEPMKMDRPTNCL